MASNQTTNLYQLIGAPLVALVKGEAQAAQTTADFIQALGFEADDGSEANPSKLRTFSFLHDRADGQGNMQTHKAEIPLLSLMTIPTLQIKEAEVEFGVEVRGMMQAEGGGETAVADTPSKTADFFNNGRTELLAAISRSHTEPHMKIKMTVEQSHLPAGVSHLLGLMGNHIISGLHDNEA